MSKEKKQTYITEMTSQFEKGKYVIIGTNELAKICLNMILKLDCPMLNAAATYGFAFSL